MEIEKKCCSLKPNTRCTYYLSIFISYWLKTLLELFRYRYLNHILLLYIHKRESRSKVYWLRYSQNIFKFSVWHFCYFPTQSFISRFSHKMFFLCMKRPGQSWYIEDYFTIVTGITIFNPLGTISSLVNGNGVYFAGGL